MTPAIVPSAKMRWATTPIGGKHGGNFGHAQVKKSRLDDHFTCEFHPR